MDVIKMPEKEGLQQNIVDVMVAGYLARCNYVCSYKCLTEESPNLRSQMQYASGKVAFDDMLHGKRLDEIIIMFNECGGVLVPRAFLDFGSKLRDLVNEYTALTNPETHYSSVQKSLYGKHVPPSVQSRSTLKETPKKCKDIHSDVSGGAEGISDDSGTSVSSSARRYWKCTQPISTKSRLVENVMHAAQNAIEGRAATDAAPMMEANTISLCEGVMDNLDGSFLSYFPEMVASEFDMLDLAEPSTSHSELHCDTSLISNEKNMPNEVVLQEEKDSRPSHTNLTTIPQHCDVSSVYENDDRELSVCSPHYQSERQNKNDEGKKQMEFSKRRKKQEPASKKKHKIANESSQKPSEKVNDIDEDTIREADVQKKKLIDCKKLTLEDLFDDDTESKVAGNLADTKQKTDTDFKSKKFGATAENSGNFENIGTDVNMDIIKKPEVHEPFKSPQSNVSEDEPKSEMTKEKQKSTEDSLRKVEGWVKLTAGGREKDEKGESEEVRHSTDSKSSGKLKKVIGDNAESEDEVRKLVERKRSVSAASKDTNEEKPVIVKKVVSDIEARKEKQCDDSESTSSLVVNASGAVNEQKKEADEAERSVKHAEEVMVIPPKSSVNAENPSVFLEDGELLPSPQKTTKCEVQHLNESKQIDREKKKLKAEDKLSVAETSSKERKRKEKELKLRKEREEVDRLRKKQMEDEDRKAAYREQKRKKELEKSAKEKEERERRRREKFAKNENRRKGEVKRGQRDLYASEDATSKGKQDYAETGGSSGHEISGRANGKNMDLSEDALFGTAVTSSDKCSRKQRDLKGKDLSETRSSVSKKLYNINEKSASSNGSKKDDLKMKGDKDNKLSKSDTSSGSRRTKNDGNKRQELSIDNLFETMATPPGSSKREETAGFEKTKRSYDFLRRVIATVEEKSGNERTKKEKVVSSGVDKGRPNLLVRGGHSARGVSATSWVNGMVLEMATRIRRKIEHDAAVGTTSSLSASDVKGSGCSKFVPQSSSDKDISQRKRVLQLPLPKAFPVDIVGDILKDSSYKETQMNRLKRYGIKKIGSERLERSSVHSSAESPRSTTLLTSSAASASTSASPHPYLSPEITPSSEENTVSFLQPLKKPRLEDNAIDFVLDSIYGNAEDD